MDRQEEFEAKLEQVRSLLEAEQVEGILISEPHSFAWMTCGGDNHVMLSGPTGSGSVLVTADEAYLICSNVEERRLTEEETAGLPLEVRTFNWHDGSDRQVLRELVGRGAPGCDVPRSDAKDVSKALMRLRYRLLPPEVERLRWLGREAEAAMRQACLEAEMGESEFELAGRVAGACYARKMLPLLTLVAVDDRIAQIRHPIPTDKELEQTAMLVLCARRWGLYANLTRLISFGPLDADLRRRHDAVTLIDATMIASSTVGTPYRDIFERALKTYREVGYPDDWRWLHLGGTTGYAGRYFKANPACEEVVEDSQAITWNPAIDGTKSEDTILVTEDEIAIVTEAKDWPMVEHEVDKMTIERPDILIR